LGAVKFRSSLNSREKSSAYHADARLVAVRRGGSGLKRGAPPPGR